MDNKKAIQMTAGRVGYYWEGGNFPVIEVFLSDTKEKEVKEKVEELEKTLRRKSISNTAVDIDYESFTSDYHRIIGVFDFKAINENMFLTVVKELERLGEKEYSLEVY